MAAATKDSFEIISDFTRAIMQFKLAFIIWRSFLDILQSCSNPISG